MNRTARIATIVSISALLVAGWLVAGGAAGAETGSQPAVRNPIGPPVNVSRMRGNQTEAAIAINPTDPRNLVVTSNLETADGLFKAVSFDDGRTWETDIIADGDNLGVACCDPTMSWDPYGNLFLGYLDTSFNSVPVAISTDGGVTFELVQKVKLAFDHPAGGTAGRGTGFTDQPTVTSGADSVWVAVNQGGQMQASGAPVTGLGEIGHFPETQVAPGTNGCSFGDVSIGPEGQVFQVCQNPTGGEGPAVIWGNLDADGLGSGGFGPAIRITRTNVGGFDYIPVQSGRSVDAEAGLAWDRTGGPRNGRLYMLYTEETVNENDDMNILLRYSEDDGATWTPPMPVSDDPGTNTQFLPRIALDQTTGCIAASWHDARNDLGDGQFGDTNGRPNDDAMFYGTFSCDGATTFGRNRPISDGVSNDNQANNGIDYGDYTGLDYHAGHFHPVWADNSNSSGDNSDGTLNEFDLYSARVRVRVR